MGLFSFLKGKDINQGVQQYKSTSGAMLIDVREENEYAAGHIEGAVNIPLSTLVSEPEELAEKNQPLFVYCLSGVRSAEAVRRLVRMGYISVTDIGGISSYRGKIAK